MDKSRKITYAMLEVALDKAIRDAEANPQREIRNLVDMGSQLAAGRFLQDFFRITRQMLNDDNCPYYELARNVIHNVNHKNIKVFGLHLGYNSLTYGANKISAYERKHGYNIPWVMVFDLRQEDPNLLTTAEISDILLHSESMGIYCAMFFVNKNQAYLEAILETLPFHSNSAFFVFADPEIITDEIADRVARANNIALVLAMATGAEKRAEQRAFEILLKKKCLYGAYCEYNDQNLEQAMSETYLHRIEKAHCTFAFLIRDELNKASNIDRFSQFIQEAKNANKYPFFIFDFYEDLAHVDRTISFESCFLSIQGNGRIAINTMTALQDSLNIRTHSLADILAKTMPKVNDL